MDSAGEKTTLKYQLLNPARQFRDIVDAARAVILAGGTMSPVSVLCGHIRSEMNVEPFTDIRSPESFVSLS